MISFMSIGSVVLGEFVTAVEIDVLPGDQGNLLEYCCAIDVTDTLPVCEQA